MIKRTFGSNILVLFGYSQILLAANLPRTNEKSLAKHPLVSAAARSWSTQTHQDAGVGEYGRGLGHAARLPFSSEAYLWFDLCRQLQEPSRSAYGSRAQMTPLVQENQQEPRQKN